MIDLHQGDCLKVMNELIDQGITVDMILTDPPYGVTDCKWDTVIPLNLMWQHINGLIKERGAIALFGTEPFSSKLRSSNLKNYKYDWIWQKNIAPNFLQANRMPLKNHEIVSVFYKKAPLYNPQKTEGTPYTKISKGKLEIYSGSERIPTVNKDGKRHPKTVIKFDVERGFHPTQKPVKLLEYLIKTYTNETDTVLDFTMGSGSTGVACRNTNRNFIGIELDKKYFEIAEERINGVQNQKKLI